MRIIIVARLTWCGFVDVFGYGEKLFLLGKEYKTSLILITHFPTLLFVPVELEYKLLCILDFILKYHLSSFISTRMGIDNFH